MKHWRVKRLAMVLAAGWCLGTVAAEAPLTLVADGKARSVIIIPAWPNEAAVFGAKELQDHIKLITGAEVPVITDREKPPEGHVQILVGESRATRALGLSTRDFKPQEYQLKFLPGAVALLGFDRTDYPVVQGPVQYGPGKFGRAVVGGWACLGVRDHGFDDARGSMECFIQKPAGTNAPLTGGVLLQIGDDRNMHSLRGKETLTYEVRADGNPALLEYDYTRLTPGWHHVMCTWDAAAAKAALYVDGREVASGPYTKTACAGAPKFGVRGGSDGVPYAWGAIDEVRLSRIVRTPEVPGKPLVPDDDTLALLHLDGGDTALDSSEYPRRSPDDPPRNDRSATLYAVYDFLEDYCDVQWYFPGELGRVHPTSKTLTIGNGRDVRRVPAMICRETTGNIIGGDGPDGDRWGKRMGRVLSDNSDVKAATLQGYRMRAGGAHLYANHSFYGYCDRYKIWKANPRDEQLKGYEDEVALFEKGTFVAQGYPEPTQLCYTSPDALAQVVKDARAFFDTGAAKPGANVAANTFNVVPGDDGYWCKCENCQALLLFPNHENDNKIPVFFGNGMESNASCLVWDFTRRVANEVKKTHPDKYIGQLAYIEYFGYPRDKAGKMLELPDNIVLGSCHGFGVGLVEWDPKKSGELQIYEEWMAVAKAKKWPTSFWYYECFPNEFGGMRGFKNWPGFFSRSLEKVIKRYQADGVDGLFLCGVSPYIEGWLTFKLMYNPDFDIDKALEKFFADYYGPAAKPMRTFYEEVQAQYLNPSNYPGGKAMTQEFEDWAYKGTPPVMARLKGSMGEAWSATGDGTEPAFRKRVELFDDAVWKHMQEGYDAWCAKQPGGKHPWPFMLLAGDAFTPMRPATTPFPNKDNGAYFRGGANVIGLRDHRFDDRKGTMEGWVWCGPMRTNWCQGPGTLFEINGEEPFCGHRVSLEAVKGRFVARYEVWNGGVTSLIQSAELKTNAWHHLMARWDATGAKPAMTFHVDGVQAGARPYKQTACASASAFGVGGRSMTIRQPAGPAGFGPIDEVRLSNVIRKPGRQGGPYKPDVNTLLLLHFDEPEGEIIRDHSGVKR